MRARRPPPARVFRVADYMAPLGIPAGGLNFTTGAPVNATAAILAALAAAAASDGGLVLLPVGKFFVDGPLMVPPDTTIRGAGQAAATATALPCVSHLGVNTPPQRH